MSTTQFTEKQNKIISMRDAGSSYKEIMSQIDCSQQFVYKTLFLAGRVQKKGRSKISEEIEKQICDRRTEGATYMELSVEFKISAPMVNKILRKHGLTKSR